MTAGGDPAGGAEVYLTAGYDAGTEVNTEDFADLVPPCPALLGLTSEKPGTGETDPALAEGGVITHHSGITGGVDLDPGVSGWRNPVAKITITRVNETARRFTTDLSGAAEVPPVATFATGKATFEMDPWGPRLHYALDVEKISGVTQAHIHYESPSKNVPVVAFLFGLTDPQGLITGRLSQGTLVEADLLGPFEGDWARFIEALRQGRLYVNVHTADVPSGELRGQIGAASRGHGHRHGLY